LRYLKKRSTEQRSPKLWRAWFWKPALLTASRYQDPLSVRITGRSAQAPPPQSAWEPERVLRGSCERGAEPDGPPRLRVNPNPHVEWLTHAPRFTTLNHESTAMTGYSCGFGSKLSFTSTLLTHSSMLDFETGSEGRPKKLEVFPPLERLRPKALSRAAITLSSKSSNLLLFLIKNI